MEEDESSMACRLLLSKLFTFLPVAQFNFTLAGRHRRRRRRRFQWKETNEEEHKDNYARTSSASHNG